MDHVLKDKRFSHISKDPRFRRMPKHERKVKIDKRFKDMFSDKRFKLKYSVDKRGRPANTTTNENLKKYYELSDSDDSDSDDDEEEESENENKHIESNTEKGKKSKAKTGKAAVSVDSVVKKGKKDVLIKENISKVDKQTEGKTMTKMKEMRGKNVKDKTVKEVDESSSDDDDDDDDDTEDDDDGEESDNESGIGSGPDLARGEGNIESSSSEDDDDDDDEEDEDSEELTHDWAELDKNVPEAETLGRRLAVCNMDWDRIKARDIFVLLHSFVPTGGTLKSVKIYPSEYGLERMKEEAVKGPMDLAKGGKSSNKGDNSSKGTEAEDFDAEDEEGGTYHREKLRQYQLNRLKYYYAVVETDSIATANKIYEECDAMEYESSATRLDLRFIPDDMTFDQEVKSECREMPGSYKPNLFSNTALAQSKVDLTWDETDRDRLKVTMFNPNQGKGKKDEVQEDDFKAYLASSSDEEEPGEGIDVGDSDAEVSGSEASDNEESHINKYRQLVQSLADDKKGRRNRDVEMEISWEPGLRETTEKIIKKKEKEKDKTPWEEYLMKKKEKKRQKREERQKERQDAKTAEASDMRKGKEEDDSEDEGRDEKLAFSDDEIPGDINMDDPYFSHLHSDEEDDKHKKRKGKEKKTKKKKEKQKRQENVEDESKKAELALLMMDEEEDKRKHFNLKSIMKGEGGKKKKKKSKSDIGSEKTDNDDFKIDVADPRFSAIYDSHVYNIDPSAKEYKKTQGMEAVIKEKIKRRTDDVTDGHSVKKRKKAVNKDNSETGDLSVEKATHKEGGVKDASLASLVKSVKAKTHNFKSKMKR